MCNMSAVGQAPSQMSMPAQVAGTTGTGATLPNDVMAQLQALADAVAAIQQALSGAGIIQQGPIQGPIQGPVTPPVDPTQGGTPPVVDPTQGGTPPVVDPTQGGTPPTTPSTPPAEPAPTSPPAEPAPTDPGQAEPAPAATPAPVDESTLAKHRELITTYEGKVANQQATIAEINGFLEGKRAENDQMRNRIDKLQGKSGSGPEIKDLKAKIQANMDLQAHKRDVLKVVRANMQQNVDYIATIKLQIEAYLAGAGA